MNSKVKDDLESLSKNVYLESPDLWIDFVDKVNNEIIAGPKSISDHSNGTPKNIPKPIRLRFGIREA